MEASFECCSQLSFLFKLRIIKMLSKTFKIILTMAVILQMNFVEATSLESGFENTKNKLFVHKESVDFYMFASLGLSDVLLRQMLDYAKNYNGVIVLRGIENNSFRQTADHIQRLAREGEEAAIIIDPTLFKRFQVEQVPSYVLTKEEKCPVGVSCKPSFDKITGNITPKYALEKFVEKGDLFKEAKKLLEGNK